MAPSHLHLNVADACVVQGLQPLHLLLRCVVADGAVDASLLLVKPGRRHRGAALRGNGAPVVARKAVALAGHVVQALVAAAPVAGAQLFGNGGRTDAVARRLRGQFLGQGRVKQRRVALALAQGPHFVASLDLAAGTRGDSQRDPDAACHAHAPAHAPAAPHLFIDSLVADDDGARFHAQAAAGADAEVAKIARFRVVQQLSDLVQQDGDAGNAHPVRHTEHGADLARAAGVRSGVRGESRTARAL